MSRPESYQHSNLVNPWDHVLRIRVDHKIPSNPCCELDSCVVHTTCDPVTFWISVLDPHISCTCSQLWNILSQMIGFLRLWTWRKEGVDRHFGNPSHVVWWKLRNLRKCSDGTLPESHGWSNWFSEWSEDVICRVSFGHAGRSSISISEGSSK